VEQRIFFLVTYNFTGASWLDIVGCDGFPLIHLVFMVQFLIEINSYGNTLYIGSIGSDTTDRNEIRNPDL
jgi:hypothetical protein